MRDKILYLSNSILPNDAAGIRINRIADLLIQKGFEVDFFCSGYSYNTDNISNLEECSKLNCRVIYNNKLYYFPKQTSNKLLRTFFGYLDFFCAFSTYRRIKDYLKINKISTFILYNDFGILTKRLINFCKNKSIKIFQDVTEWYEKKDKPLNFSDRFIPKLVNKRIIFYDYKLSGVIAISNYLYSYYSTQNTKVFRLPPLMDYFQKPLYKKNNVFNIVYAGSSGEKDLLLPLIEAVRTINNDGNYTIKLIIIGNNNINLEDENIYCIPKIPHKEVASYLCNADLSVLLRRNLRYSKAGYSTKFAEAMSLGIPMLCTKVGGCDLDICDFNNGFLIDNNDVESILSILAKILNLYYNDYSKFYNIKINAYNTALSMFNPNTYSDDLIKFLELK